MRAVLALQPERVEFQVEVSKRDRERLRRHGIAHMHGAVVDREMGDGQIERRALGVRGGLRGRSGRLGGRRAGAREFGQIERAAAIARDFEHRPIEADLVEMQRLPQRLELRGRDVQRLRAEQRRAARLRELGAGQIDRARHAQRGRIAGHRERQVQIARQLARRHRHGQLGRRIREQARYVETGELERDLRFARRRERLDLAVDRERAPVETRAQLRRDEHVELGAQIRDERNAERPLVDHVLLVQQAVVEIDAAVGDLDVGHGETRRRTARRGRFGKLIDEIGEIETLRVVAHDVDVRRLELDLVDDRRPAQHREPRRAHHQLADIDEGPGAARFAHVNPVRLQAQAVRIQRDARDRGGAAELFAQLPLGHVPQQRRRGEEAEQSERHEEDRHPHADTPRAACA